MADLFDKLVENLLAKEGGYSNDPTDRGGETIWGVTKEIARSNGYTGAMRSMTREQAKGIYRSHFWVKPGLNLIAPISAEVAAELFDTGVNCGIKAAGLFLQRSLNALNRGGTDYPDVAADGVIGPGTAQALRAYVKVRGAQGETVLLRALNCLQGARYIQIAEADRSQERFAFGWLANRVAV